MNFLRKAIGVALNRGHSRVTEDDMLTAEQGFSQDMFQDLFFELRDVFPNYGQVLHGFTGSQERFDDDLLSLTLTEAGVEEGNVGRIVEILLWYGFLGVVDVSGTEMFSYSVAYDLERLRRLSLGALPVLQGRSSITYCVHPAFRKALGTVS